MSREPKALVCIAAGLATAAILAGICAVAMDPTNELLWSKAQARWGFVHWPLAGRWAYDFAVAAWGFALGALAAWRGRDKTVRFARWGILVTMVLGGGVVAALAVLVFPPEMPSNGTGAGALVGMAIDAIAILLFMAFHAAVLLFGGALALGVGRLVRALADGLPLPWGPTWAFGASCFALLLAGGASPRSLGAPVAVVGCAVLAGLAAWSARTHRADLAVAAAAVACAGLFMVSTQGALRWESDRTRRVAIGRCYLPQGPNASTTLAGIPGVLTGVELQSGTPTRPAIHYLARADADPAVVAAAVRADFPACTVESEFNPTLVEQEVLPASPTPLAFHYLLVDDADDPARRVAALESVLRDALVPRPGNHLVVQGYGSEPRFVQPRAEGVVFLNACSSIECGTDPHVDLAIGHFPAFGSVDVVAVDALPGEASAARNALGALLRELGDADTERARELRARYGGLEAFLDLPSGDDTRKEMQCNSLESVLDPIPAKSTDAETLYWAGREAGECASVASLPAEQAARLRKRAGALLARVPASSGVWASRAAVARATLRPPIAAAGLAATKAALDRLPAAGDAGDPLVALDVLRAYACPAKDAAMVGRLVAGIRAASSRSKSWLLDAVALRAAALEKCTTGP
jgi:hypothetical protein